MENDKPSPISNELLRFATAPGHPKTRIYQTVCKTCGPEGVSESAAMNEIVCHKCNGNDLRIIRDIVSEKYSGMLMERGTYNA